MKELVRGLLANIRACYTWRNIVWQVLAVVLTYILVASGFDWYWFTHTRSAALQSWLFPATLFGGVLPILLPAIVLLLGRTKHNFGEKVYAFAFIRAAILGLLISSLYKFFTGRIPPPFRSSTFVDISRQFNFGLGHGGVFWGWPSSHTTVAFAVAVTLFIVYKGSPVVRYGALLAALYIGVGVSANIHWFSEFVAGAIIGSVIGTVVGRSFRSML
jgi:hypothetical protein